MDSEHLYGNVSFECTGNEWRGEKQRNGNSFVSNRAQSQTFFLDTEPHPGGLHVREDNVTSGSKHFSTTAASKSQAAVWVNSGGVVRAEKLSQLPLMHHRATKKRDLWVTKFKQKFLHFRLFLRDR